MDLAEIILIAFGLAMDATAVSLVAAASGYAEDSRATFRLAFHFGLFQFLMPLIGWFAGINFVSYFASFTHWVAFSLLLFVGGRMLYSGLTLSIEKPSNDPSRGYTLIALSIATSIDALAIGLSLAMLDVNIWYPSVIIGFVTATLSLTAIKIGKKISVLFGKRMEILGGAVLIIIGFRILFTQLYN